MTSNRRLRPGTFGFCAILAGSMAIFLIVSPAARAASGQAQFCIARSGTNGENSFTDSCIYSDIQQCLRATAESRGNCVGNIDYRGEPPRPSATRSRRSR